MRARSAPVAISRCYEERDWTPFHVDVVVDDVDAAVARAVAAGPTLEAPAKDTPYGCIATLAHPFGDGFCLLQFSARGYDALLEGLTDLLRVCRRWQGGRFPTLWAHGDETPFLFRSWTCRSINRGSDAAQAFRNSLDLARHAERLGLQAALPAEHQNTPGIASAATAVAIGYVAGGGTRTIRVGSGRVTPPNDAPLVIAEQFGTLDSL